ncbi:MAG: double-strand break repair helicase AddA, partial [Pseudomonadota bacterium]
EQEVFTGGEQDLIDQIIPPMSQRGGNDAKIAARLSRLPPLLFDAIPHLEAIFLTGAKTKAPFSAKTGSLPTKATQTQLQNIMPQVDAFMQRVEAGRRKRIALQAAEKTLALHEFAATFLPLYTQEKLLRGWLDFDDLIERAQMLLGDPAVAAWVLFRIDGGIDHILVDEAQDTSPGQWDVIAKLAAEFTSGEGARQDVLRTLFVVGDKKQSIYSFQGADPREFDRMQRDFRTKFKATAQLFQERTLKYSFRSSKAILDLVDNTFDEQIAAGFDTEARHIAFNSALPGRVDLWPVIDKQEDKDDRQWFEPLDRKTRQHHDVLLAERAAHQIDTMIKTCSIPDETKGRLVRRPVRASDFLILVQKRSALFSEIIRACKARNLPMAGADRLKVGGELAVRDLAALLSFLAVPEDSLALASALKSPLFGWSEQKLFDLAHRRTQEHLWQALRTRQAEYPMEMSILNDLRGNVDFLRPYDLIERILTRHGGRKRLLARLGSEAEDGINALLSQALSFERTAVPSLTGFLVWMETDDLEIKRQIDSASDQIRVMTVHGAKGLEAPIVILPDCGQRKLDIKDEILSLDGVPVWKTKAAEMPSEMQARVKAMKEAQAQERQRLLYVALTRAEKWLIVGAGGDLPKDESAWYQQVSQAMGDTNSQTVEMAGLPVKRFSYGDWDGLPLQDEEHEQSSPASVAAYFSAPVPKPKPPEEILSPSDLGGAKALPGDTGRDEAAAKAFGTLVHQILERLTATDRARWPSVEAGISRSNIKDGQEAMEEAKSVLAAPDLTHLFSPDTLSEVPITALLGGHRLRGTIDRLIVEDTRILAIDFKTNRIVPQAVETCPEGLLRQMGAYALALAQIYPNRRIETAILWTKTRALMPLPHDIVMAALQNTPYLDAGAVAS